MGIFIGIILTALFSASFLGGFIYLANANDFSSSDFMDDSLGNISKIEANLIIYENASEEWEESSLGQGVKEYDVGEGFDLLTSTSSMWTTTKTTLTLIVKTVQNVFNIPSYIIGIFFGIMIVLGILASWKVWRAGY